MAACWNYLGRLKDTGAWVLHPRDPGFIDMRRSLGTGSCESSQGNSSVHRVGNHYSASWSQKPSVIFYATHATKWMEQADQLKQVVVNTVLWIIHEILPSYNKKILCVFKGVFLGGVEYEMVSILKLDKYYKCTLSEKHIHEDIFVLFFKFLSL